MASIVLRVMSLTLGLFFVFVGTIKLTPSVNGEIYKEMMVVFAHTYNQVFGITSTLEILRLVFKIQKSFRKTYIRNSKVFPLVKQTGWKPNPHTYRKAVGTAEVVCGILLAFVPGALKEASNVVLLTITVNDIYAHFALDEGLEKMSPAIVFALLLTCRLIIFLQSLTAEPKSVFSKKVRPEQPVAPPEEKKDL